jgi:hypothetical protein
LKKRTFFSHGIDEILFEKKNYFDSMANLQRPSTSCQLQRPSLMNDNKTNALTRSYTFDGLQLTKQQQQQQTAKPLRSLSAIGDQKSQRLGRSLLSNDNWRQETMVDLRIHAKAVEQSDQNILYGKGRK